jgi:AcrR family transcriptional regulator
MPRRPDSELESRILNAAYNLWAVEGEHGLTMRAVAKAAKTSTPSLYVRFRDKRDLLDSLRRRAQRSLLAAIEPATSIAEASRRALDFTLAHGHEYELVAKDWAARLSRRESTPSFDLIKQRLAQQLGGSPNDYESLTLAIAALYHGASMLLLTEGIDPRLADQLKESCIAAVDALVEDAACESSRTRKRATL